MSARQLSGQGFIETCVGVAVNPAPTESAVGFYLRQGFRPTAEPDPELPALEPEDIHMVRQL